MASSLFFVYLFVSGAEVVARQPAVHKHGQDRDGLMKTTTPNKWLWVCILSVTAWFILMRNKLVLMLCFFFTKIKTAFPNEL